MKPKLIIDREVYKKIMHWINKSDNEVSGLGTVKVEKDGTLRVVSAILLPQKNGKTHTDIEADAVCKAMYELRESEGDLKWWWHSHPTFNVFWSGTDMDTIRSFGGGGWIAATVLNQKEEMRSAYYDRVGIKSPWGDQELFWDELETKISKELNPHESEWEEEYTRNVSNFIFPTQPVTTPQNPLSVRPEGMSKREWKRSKKEANTLINPLLVPSEVDDYGFDANDWESLFLGNYDLQDVKEFDTAGFSPSMLLTLAEAQLEPQVVRQLLAMGSTPEMIVNEAREYLFKDEQQNDIWDRDIMDMRGGYGY